MELHRSIYSENTFSEPEASPPESSRSATECIGSDLCQEVDPGPATTMSPQTAVSLSFAATTTVGGSAHHLCVA